MVTINVNKTTIASLAIIAILLVSVAAMGAQLYFPKTGNAVATTPTSGTISFDSFTGKITNANLSPQKLEGTATTDKGCGDAGNGLVNCVSDIVTSQGTLAFNYQHNMNQQQCLAMGGPEKVIVDILDSNGNAQVTRTQSVGGMGMVMNHG